MTMESEYKELDKIYNDIFVNENNGYRLVSSAAKLLAYDYKFHDLREEALLESMWYQLEDQSKNVGEDIDPAIDLPPVVPFYNPDEYRSMYENIDIDDYGYLFIKEGSRYVHLVKNLQRQMIYNENAKDKILTLGWNPQVNINEFSMKYAREKQTAWLRENKNITIIDVSDIDSEYLSEGSTTKSLLEPVYICLSYTGTFFGNVINWWKKSKYSHSALSLDSKLDHMYSFNRDLKTGEGGFFEEGIQDYKNPKMNGDCNLCIIGIFVTKEQKKKMKNTIEWYKKNKKNTSYNLKNIANIVFNKTEESLYTLSMVCSQFVDNILKIANVDITNKSNNLVSPEDFIYTANEKNKAYILFEGLKSEYNPSKIDNKVKAILSTLTKKETRRVTKKELSINMKNPLIESFNVLCIDDKYSQNILREIQNWLKPSSILVEAKRLPVGFTKRGDLYIDAPRNLEAEYQEAHKLLSVYTEDNIQGIKHELARLFYIESIIEKRMSKMDKDEREYKELVKLKARVMNDFTKYLKMVNKIEKDFDFSAYLKGTEYYNKTIVVGNHTLKYSGKYIREVLKLMGQ